MVFLASVGTAEPEIEAAPGPEIRTKPPLRSLGPASRSVNRSEASFARGLARTIHEHDPAGRISRPIASSLVAHGTPFAYPLRSSLLALDRDPSAGHPVAAEQSWKLVIVHVSMPVCALRAHLHEYSGSCLCT